jgi:hypothetical protein
MAQPQQQITQQQAKRAHEHPTNEQYWFECRACREADKARTDMKVKQVAEDDYDRTIFLIPDNEFDGQVCREFLLQKYPHAKWITSKIDLQKLGGWGPDDQVVVIRRDPWPRECAAHWKRMKEDDVVWHEQIPPDSPQFLAEVVEMEAVNVRQCIYISPATRFSKSKPDDSRLIARLTELWPPPYRIDMPRDPGGKDSEVRFVRV